MMTCLGVLLVQALAAIVGVALCVWGVMRVHECVVHLKQQRFRSLLPFTTSDFSTRLTWVQSE